MHSKIFAFRWLYLILVASGLHFSPKVQAQCLPVFFENQTLGTNRIKTGWPGFLSYSNTAPAMPVFYRRRTETFSEDLVSADGSGHRSFTRVQQLSNQYLIRYDLLDQDGCKQINDGVGMTNWSYGTVTCTTDEDEGYTNCNVTVTNGTWYPDNWCDWTFDVLKDQNWATIYDYWQPTNDTAKVHNWVADMHHLGFPGWTWTSNFTERLSDIYDTGELLHNLAVDLSTMSWPTNWDGEGYSYADLSWNQKCAEMQRMKYRFRLFGEKGEQAEFTWHEVFTPNTTNAVPITNRTFRLNITFTGNEYTSAVYFAEPPPWSGTVEVKYEQGTCSKSSCTFGSIEPENGCVSVKFGLGVLSSGLPAGRLYINEQSTTNLFSASSVKGFVHPSVERIEVSGVKQFRAPQGLADVRTTNGGYMVSFYSGYTGTKDGSGLYTLSGSPSTRYTLVQGSSTNELRVLEGGSSGTELAKYLFTPTGTEWAMTLPDGTVDVRRWSGVEETREIYDGATLRFKEIASWNDFGGSLGNLITQRVTGVQSPLITNRLIFNASVATNDPRYGQIVSSTTTGEGAGSFAYDQFGRMTNEAAGTRSFAFSYAPVSTNDSGLIETNTPRTTISYLNGTEIGREYLILTATERQMIRGAYAGAAWDDSANLTTVYRSYRLTNADIGTVLFPDQTAVVSVRVTNTDGNTLEITSQGQPTNSVTQIMNGTCTRTLFSSAKVVRWVRVASVVNGAEDIVIHYETNELDSANPSRITKTTYLDGTYTEDHYNCCNIDWSRDREGTYSTNTYGSRDRLLTTTRDGVTISNVYNAAGQVVQTVRHAGGLAMVLNSTVYDLGGRISAVTDAMNNVTRYTNFLSGNQMTRRTIYPDTGIKDELLEDGQMIKVTGNATHPASYEEIASPHYRLETKLDRNGSATAETIITGIDAFGRTSLVELGANSWFYDYNSLGQLVQVIDPDDVATAHGYNVLGERDVTGIDTDGNGILGTDPADSRTRTAIDYYLKASTWNVRRVRTYQLVEGGSEVLTSTVETSVDGLRSWSITEGGTSSNRTIYPGSGVRIQMSWRVDGSYSSNYFVNGRSIGSTQFDSTGSQIGATTFEYDAHRRQIKSIDARNGATTNAFNNADQVVSTTTPSPFYLKTLVQHDSMGRPAIITYPDNRSVTNEYHLSGELKKTAGARAYPVEYAYDAQGRVTNMMTFTSASGAGTSTRWAHDASRGWLAKKVYADNSQVSYTNTQAGRLQYRQTPRGLTTYSYNSRGELSGIDYADNSVTADVSFDYDRRGRPKQITQGTNVTTLGHNNLGQVMAETNAGVLNGFRVERGYGTFSRLETVSVLDSGGTVQNYRTFGYDNASRMASMTWGANAYKVDYQRVANSPLIETTTFKQGTSTTRMTTSRTYDSANRATRVLSTPTGGGQTVFDFQYGLNPASQRVAVTNVDGSYVVYEYDTLGQVTSAKKHWSDGSLVAGQQFEYTYDDIGNRKSAASGGNADGTHLRYESYSVNNLNQYTSRTVPGGLDVLGTAATNATVTVLGSASASLAIPGAPPGTIPASRKGEYFRAEVKFDNSAAALYPTLTNVAVLQQSGTNTDLAATNIGSVFIPKTPEVFLHDGDGNLTNDGRWSYTWDQENRLVKVESISSAPTASKRKVTYDYDFRSRMVRRTEYNDSSGSYVITNDLKFVYDGWRCMTELNGTNNTVVRSYMWGLDLSGTPEGAGGVGGLLMMIGGSTNFYAMDGNGNVAGLVNVNDGTVSANYEYDAFGKTLRATGSGAAENRFQFSTKYRDAATDFYNYGYRHYSTVTVRWLSRDPLGENAAEVLYRFVRNQANDRIDALGLRDDPGPTRPPCAPGCPICRGDPIPSTTPFDGAAVEVMEGTAYIEHGFNADEIQKGTKALCLIRKLVGPIYFPPWSDTWRAKLPGFMKGKFKEVPTGLFSSTKFILIDSAQIPKSETLLPAMVDFGSTLAHEADHYFTNSSEDDAYHRVDDAVNDAYEKARKARAPICNFCKRHNPAWLILTRIEQYACDCDIDLGTRRK